VGLATLLPSMSRLSRQCAILNISQSYRPPRPVTRIALLDFFFFFFIYYPLHTIFSVHPFSCIALTPFYLPAKHLPFSLHILRTAHWLFLCVDRNWLFLYLYVSVVPMLVQMSISCTSDISFFIMPHIFWSFSIHL
jgi:hypothetical protein